MSLWEDEELLAAGGYVVEDEDDESEDEDDESEDEDDESEE